MWRDLDLNIATLEAETVNQVYENAAYLKQVAESKGITVSALTNPNASYSTQIVDVLSVLQNTENDVAVINEDVTESIYFDEQKTIGSRFTLSDYQRWVLCLSDLYDILVNEKGQWGQLYLTQEENQPDVQINENDVYIRGDMIA